MEKFVEAAVKFVLVVLFGVVSSLVQVLALLRVWQWFWIPYLHVPALGFWPLAGVALLVDILLLGMMPEYEKNDASSILERSTYRAFSAVAILGLAAIIHYWVL